MATAAVLLFAGVPLALLLVDTAGALIRRNG
jgi:hypothetical protein